MRTKIAASLGIALALVFGILGVMAFFGSIPVQAHENAGIAEATDADSLGNLVTDVKVEAVPNTPGSVAKWTVQFKNGTTDNIAHAHTDAENTTHINTDQDDNILSGGLSGDVIKVEFEDDVQFPADIGPTEVTITTNMVAESDGSVINRTVVANPLDVDITKVSEFDGSAQKTGLPQDETLVTVEIPDMEPSDDRPGSQGIAPGALVTVVFRQTAEIKNPTESKEDVVSPTERAQAVDANGDFDASLLKPLSGFKVQVSTSNNGHFVLASEDQRAVIAPRLILSDRDGPRGAVIQVMGVGFRQSTTATVWNDKNANGMRDGGETNISSTSVTTSGDFLTPITIDNPPFNYDLSTNGINAVDGLNRTIVPGRRYMGAISGTTFTEAIPMYLLESSISVVPSTAGIGDTVRVTAREFLPGGDIANARISIGGVPVTEHDSTVVSNTGDAVFNVVIPDSIASGTQNFVVKDGPNAASDPTHDIVNTGGARFNIVILGAQLSVTPSQGLVPNQAVTLVGRDFSTGGAARINVTGSEASISGDDTDMGLPSEKLNEGDPIEVDNAGNWSSSFVIPVTDVTTTPGNHELSITDTEGRSGSVNLNMAERRLTLTPALGRVGTRVNVEGSGFPADNPAEGADTTVIVEIIYSTIASGPQIVATLTPDGSGNISGWFTVPLNAGIPSTNAVRAVFEVPASNVTVTTSAVHQVPRASITLDKQSGPSGTVVTINGEGFKRYTTVSEVNFGTQDVSSSSGLSTDGEGVFETTFLVPSTNTGAQAVVVRVGGTTASATFTVTAVPIVPGAPTIITSPIIAGPNSLTVTWAAPGSTGGPVVIAYDLRYIRTDAEETVEANWTAVEDIWTGSGGLEYLLTGLAAGTLYDVQLRAVHVTGEGPWSATGVGTPATWGATRFYSRVHVGPGSAVVVIVTASGYGASGRVVEKLPPGFSYVSGSLPEPSVMATGQEVSFTLTGNQAFTYVVTASSMKGSYSFSGVVINADESEQPVAGISGITVRTAPSVYATSDTTTTVRFNSPISVTVAFSEPVLDFTVEDVDASNGVVSNFTGSSGAAFYTFDVTPNAAGAVTVDIAAGVATGSDGNGNTASPQLLLGIPYDDDRDGTISKDEAITAVVDYFTGRITKSDAIGVIILYFSS